MKLLSIKNNQKIPLAALGICILPLALLLVIYLGNQEHNLIVWSKQFHNGVPTAAFNYIQHCTQVETQHPLYRFQELPFNTTDTSALYYYSPDPHWEIFPDVVQNCTTGSYSRLKLRMLYDDLVSIFAVKAPYNLYPPSRQID